MNDVKVRFMSKGNWGKSVAYFDVDVNGVTIKGCRLVEGENGLFVSLPSIRKEKPNKSVREGSTIPTFQISSNANSRQHTLMLMGIEDMV